MMNVNTNFELMTLEDAFQIFEKSADEGLDTYYDMYRECKKIESWARASLKLADAIENEEIEGMDKFTEKTIFNLKFIVTLLELTEKAFLVCEDE